MSWRVLGELRKEHHPDKRNCCSCNGEKLCLYNLVLADLDMIPVILSEGNCELVIALLLEGNKRLHTSQMAQQAGAYIAPVSVP